MSEFKRAFDYARGFVGTQWDRLQQIERDAAAKELDDSFTPTPDPVRRPVVDERGTARKVLGVEEGASLEAMQAAHDRLMERSDPARFPEGSPERTQADEIRRRVRRAFATLTDDLDGTERRFRTLEL